MSTTPIDQQSASGLRNWLRETPSWALSLGVHMVIMVVALTFQMPKIVKTASDMMTMLEDVAENETLTDTTDRDVIGTMSENNIYAAQASTGTASAAALASGTGAGPLDRGPMAPRLDAGFEDADIAAPSDGDIVSGVEGSDLLDGAGQISKGAIEVTEGGTAGAIDRLTQELQASLRERKTLAIWLFDASLSLKDRRAMIAERFENVYRQLDALEATKANGLTTVVAHYGEKFTLLTKDPITDIRTIVPKIKAIPNDTSGKEFTFTAVKTLATQFQKYRRDGQNIMMFIITDERGNDQNLVDEAILLCRRASVRVYTVGNASLFGREESFFKWKYDDGFEEELTMDGGPETVEPEVLALGYWGADGRDLTRMSSGYGPYALTRLCKETGGMYFITENGVGKSFDPGVMRNYAPDYRPAKEYLTAKAKSPARIALIEAAKKTKLETMDIPLTFFRADTDGALKDAITEAQKPAATLFYKLDQVYKMLQTGEKDREKLKEPRWRAGYDLAMGRVLAMQVRYHGYNKLLAEMKSTPLTFKKKESNQWRIAPAKEITAGADVGKMAKQSVAYLKRVIDDHPDTPWAMMAQRELGTPMGWQWIEAVGDYPKENPNESQEQKRIRLAREEQKRREMMKNAPPPRTKPIL